MKAALINFSNRLNFLITGGAGFIGSAVIRHIINNTNHSVVNVDKLTYAGNLELMTLKMVLIQPLKLLMKSLKVQFI